MSDRISTSPIHGITLADGVSIARIRLRWTFSRASGPGGQAVNKLSTRATLRVAIADIRELPPDAAARLRQLAGSRLTQDDEIVISAETYRSQLDNKEACVERLAHLVSRSMIRPKVRRKKKPKRSMIEKRLPSKRRQSEKKSLRKGRRAGGAEG
jgi:ribosome-associated protein